MLKAVLTRTDSGDEGTFGSLHIDGRFFAYTGELPWRNNESNVSCIPLGIYTCTFTHSPRFGYRMYLVGPVDRRTGIRIHAANLMGDAKKGYKCQLNGCIALGEKLGWIGKQKAVLVSRPAIRRLEKLTEGKPFQLEIING